MRVYIETTIPSYVVARASRSPFQEAHQQITKRWWESERKKHDLFTSQVTLDEVVAGDSEMAAARVALLADARFLALTAEAESLAKLFLSSGVLPFTADRDALHIALAAAHQMDILLSWNCRHIANASIQMRLRRLAVSSQYELPLLCTPEQFFDLTP